MRKQRTEVRAEPVTTEESVEIKLESKTEPTKVVKLCSVCNPTREVEKLREGPTWTEFQCAGCGRVWIENKWVVQYANHNGQPVVRRA